MKSGRGRLAACAVFAAVALAAVGCAGVQTLKGPDMEPIPLPELEANPAMYGFPDVIYGSGAVIEIPEGTRIPLKVESNITFASIEPGENMMRFDRKVYLFLSEKRAMISPDAVRWAEFQDWDTIKDLFGLHNGRLSLGFGITKEEGSAINLVLEATP